MPRRYAPRLKLMAFPSPNGFLMALLVAPSRLLIPMGTPSRFMGHHEPVCVAAAWSLLAFGPVPLSLRDLLMRLMIAARWQDIPISPSSLMAVNRWLECAYVLKTAPLSER